MVGMPEAQPAADALTGGFADPAIEAAIAFRAALDALARPGTIRDLPPSAPPPPLSPAAGALVLTLLDQDTPVWLAADHDRPDTRAWIAFHTGAPVVADPAAAAFAIGAWSGLTGRDFATGTSEYPDRSATLIVELPTLGAGGARLTGPGIADTAWMDLPDGLAAARRAAYPLGWDAFLTAGRQVAGLPRTTEIAGCMSP